MLSSHAPVSSTVQTHGPELQFVRRGMLGDVSIRVKGGSGATYVLEVSDDLVSWVQLGMVADRAGLSSFIDQNLPAHNQRFYRAVLNMDASSNAGPLDGANETGIFPAESR